MKANFFKNFVFIKARALQPVIAETETLFYGIPSHDNPIAGQPATASLQISKKDHPLTLFLNRPNVLNAIDIEMAQALQKQLKQAALDPTIRVVVIMGRGRAFCAGGDLKFALKANPDQPGDSFQGLTSIFT